MNAIVYAAGLNTEKQNDNERMSFLLLEDKPLLLYVLMALDRVSDIHKIIVIGETQKVMRVIESVMFTLPFQTTISVCEPKSTLTESLSAALAQISGTGPTHAALPMLSDPVLILGGHIPFVTSAEISTFIAASNLKDYDFCAAIANQSVFNAFLQQKQISEIPKPVYTVSEGKVYLGRLFLAHPNRLQQGKTLQKIMQFFERFGIESGYPEDQSQAFLRWAKTQNSQNQEGCLNLSQVSDNIGSALQARVQWVETQTGGHAIAVETDQSYQFAAAHFDHWRAHITHLKSDEGEKICSITGSVCDSEGHEH